MKDIVYISQDFQQYTVLSLFLFPVVIYQQLTLHSLRTGSWQEQTNKISQGEKEE